MILHEITEDEDPLMDNGLVKNIPDPQDKEMYGDKIEESKEKGVKYHTLNEHYKLDPKHIQSYDVQAEESVLNDVEKA